MAAVKLVDIVDPQVWMDMDAEIRPEKTSFIESQAVFRDPLADELANLPGRVAELAYWLDLDPTVEPNYSSDADVDSTPLKAGQTSMTARKAFLNQSWAAKDLARELQMGEDAMRFIKRRVDTYWTRQWERRVIATLRGVMARNIANNSGDMVVNVALETTVGVTDANKFDRTVFSSGLFTMGDMAESLLSLVLVHSVVYKKMIDNDDITFIPDSEGRLIATYFGARVEVTDMAPVIPGTTSGFKYVTTLVGRRALAWGEGNPIVPIETERLPATGHGGGGEVLYSRKTVLVHPYGHDNLGANINGNGISQTLADLQLATNWSRLYARKNVPIAFIITNG